MSKLKKLVFLQDRKTRKDLIRANRKGNPVSAVLAICLAMLIIWTVLSVPFYVRILQQNMVRAANAAMIGGMEYVLALGLTALTGVIPFICVFYLRAYLVDRKIANKHQEKLELTSDALTNTYKKWMDAVKGAHIAWHMPYGEINRIVYMPNVKAVRVYGNVYYRRELRQVDYRTEETGRLDCADPCRVLYMYYQQGDAWLKELAARTGLTIEEDSTDRLPDEEKI